MQLGGSGEPGLGDPRRRRLLRGRSGRFRVWPIVIFGAFFAYCYFSHQEEVPLTGRKQLVDLSREQEAALGLESYRQILGQSQIVESGAAVDAIREIGRRLAAVAEAPGFEWEFNLIASDQANAFALPGGKVAVYSGLLPVTKNADGLAAVMGHEIAHAIARHGAGGVHVDAPRPRDEHPEPEPMDAGGVTRARRVVRGRRRVARRGRSVARGLRSPAARCAQTCLDLRSPAARCARASRASDAGGASDRGSHPAGRA